MGRAHPLGVVLAAFLFGVLYQGGTELSFDKPAITRDMIVVIQGFVILFAGALDYAFKRPSPCSSAKGRPDGGARHCSFRCSPRRSGWRRPHLRLPRRPLVGAGRRRRHRPRGQDAGGRLRRRRGAALVTGSALAGLGAGIIVSILFSLVHGYASISQRGNQIVSGVAINALAAGLAAVLGNAWYREGGRTPPVGQGQRFLPFDLPFADGIAGGPCWADLQATASRP